MHAVDNIITLLYTQLKLCVFLLMPEECQEEIVSLTFVFLFLLFFLTKFEKKLKDQNYFSFASSLFNC